tara:strand:- start:1164 stop:1568 length:405 start_codon:yes stop_codon:yes gene_type:complete
MESIYGPTDTSSFELILKDQVIPKDELLILAREGQIEGRGFGTVTGGAVILTDKRFIFAEWKTTGFRYSIEDSYDYNEIESAVKVGGFFATMNSTPYMTGQSFVLTISGKEFQYSAQSVEYVLKEINKRLYKEN